MKKPVNILHHTWKIGPASFGLGPAVLNLAREQAVLGNRTSIWSFDNAEEIKELSVSGAPECPSIRTFSAPWSGKGYFCPDLLRAATVVEEKFDVVHQHGIWTANSRLSRRLGKLRDRPVIISPHGSLEAWALKRSGVKKKAALLFFEKNNLENAACLHALSEQEAASMRTFGLRNPIAIIPNGIDRGWLNSHGDGTRFRRSFGLIENRRILLFLSRITPVKGLLLLLKALTLVPDLHREWQVVIAGVDEFGHLREVQQSVNLLGLDGIVRFVGPLYGRDKRDAFDAAELFVLPSYRDAAPMVVLEAMGAGVPVLTTQGTPWKDLPVEGCGWWTEIDAKAIADALQEATGKSDTELRGMGECGRNLVSSRYQWHQVALLTADLYQWLLGVGERPPFVFTN